MRQELLRRARALMYMQILVLAATLPALAQSQLSADFNSDGRPDIVTAQGTYLNQGGTLAPLASFGLSGTRSLVAVGDFNNDGKQDVAVAGPDLVVLLGNGDGSFQSPIAVSVTGIINSLAAADFNGDGKSDLVVCTRSVGLVRVLVSAGNGSFQAGPSYAETTGCFVGADDVDGDGNADFIVSAKNHFSMYAGDGNGSFLNYQFHNADYCCVPGADAFAIGDLNRDGRNDLLMKVHGEDGSYLGYAYINQGGWNFGIQEFRTGTGTGQVTLGDFNSDGRLDFAVYVSYDYLLGIGLGNGDGTFSVTNYAAGLADGDKFLTAVDLDGDGKSELVSRERIVRGDAAGQFALPINYYSGNEYTHHMSVADFTGDGRPDAVVDGRLLTNSGSGAFGHPLTVGGRGPSTAGDFNGDGKQDLLLFSFESGGPQPGTRLGNGNGTFQPPIAFTAVFDHDNWTQLLNADFNGDGNLDVVVGHYEGPFVLLGNGDGSFQPELTLAMPGYPLSFAVADFDEDGKVDVAVSSDEGGLRIFRWSSGGGFEEFASDANGGLGIAAADLNHDGLADLALASMGTLTVLTNTGGGTFQAFTYYFPAQFNQHHVPVPVAALDFNRDGCPDIAVASNGVLRIFDGDASGGLTLQPQIPLAAGEVLRMVSTDINGDGDDDLLVLQNNFWHGLNFTQVGVLAVTNPNPAANTTNFSSFTSSTASALLGQSITFSWQVAANVGIPTGTVKVYDGINLLGEVALNAQGQGTLATSTLAAGAHTIRAVYGGQGSFVGSEATLNVTVIAVQAVTYTSVQASPHNPVVLQPVSLQAHVVSRAGKPTGTVTFMTQTGVTLGTVELDASGSATLMVTYQTPGVQKIKAVFNGSAGFLSSTSQLTTFVVGKYGSGPRGVLLPLK